MVAFGGAGGLFATEVADFLGIERPSSRRPIRAICAPSACTSPTSSRDYIRTLVRRQIDGRRGRDRRGLERAGSGRSSRYRGGGHLRGRRSRSNASPTCATSARATRSRSTIPGRPRRALPLIAYMWKDFHKVHDRDFGFHYRGEQDVELVNLRVQAVGSAEPAADQGPIESRATPAAPFGSARSTGARPAGSSARSSAARSSRLGQRSTGRRSSRSTARPWSCRPAGRSVRSNRIRKRHAARRPS